MIKIPKLLKPKGNYKRLKKIEETDLDRDERLEAELELSKSTPKKRIPLTAEEIEKLLDMSKYDYICNAIFRIELHTSGRAGEICSINIEDINFETKEINIHNQKAKREEYIAVSDECLDSIKQYLKHRGKPNNDKDSKKALFINKYGKRIKYTSILDYHHKYGVKMELNRTLHPHLIRHSTITMLAEQGKNVFEIQTISHHKDVRALQKYVSISKDKQREIANSITTKKPQLQPETSKPKQDKPQKPEKPTDNYIANNRKSKLLQMYKQGLLTADELEELLTGKTETKEDCNYYFG